MFSWLRRLFGREKEYNQFASADEKLAGMGVGSFSVFTERGIDIYEQSQYPLDDESEAVAKQLSIASHAKDRDKVKEIGRQLNDAGGLDRMKLLCYRARHIGGDDRWIEMMWSGIGEWDG
jgi:hypothetical protein